MNPPLVILFVALAMNARGITLTGIEEIRFDGAKIGSAEGGGIIFKNLRVRSNQTTFNDYIEAKFQRAPTGGTINLQDATVYPNVGIFLAEDEFFVKDVQSDVFMYRTAAQPNQYAMDTYHTLASSSGPYLMNLVAGHHLAFHFSYPSAAASVVVTSPSGREVFQTGFGTLTYNSNLVTSLPVLESGIHRVDIVPEAGTNANVRFRFLNNNRNAVRVGTDGKAEAFVLRGYSQEYEKLKLSLQKNQSVEIRFQTLSGPIDIGFVNSKGAIAGIGGKGAAPGRMWFTATAADDYHLFFHAQDPTSGTNINVAFTTHITTNLSFAQWAGAYSVSPLRRGPADDSDRDGSQNIVEYAFGTDPSSPSSVFTPGISRSGSQLKMNYRIPPYVEGVTVTPQQSASLGVWQNVGPVQTESNASGKRFEATTTGNSKAKFLRLKVD